MKKGKPKDITKSKNRVHCITLTEKAEMVFKETCKKRGNIRWLNRYISEHIINDFGSEEAWEIYQINKMTKDRNTLDIQIKETARRLNESRGNKEFKKAMQNVGIRE